jgi:hypothetical protein
MLLWDFCQQNGTHRFLQLILRQICFVTSLPNNQPTKSLRLADASQFAHSILSHLHYSYCDNFFPNMYGPSKPLFVPLNLQYPLESLRFQLILKRWLDLDRLIRLSQFLILL